MTTVTNPLPRPETIAIEIKNEIKEIIKYKLSKNELDFHTMTDFFEEQIEQNKLDKATICGFYLINVIITTNTLNISEKNELIGSICRDISDLKFKLELEPNN